MKKLLITLLLLGSALIACPTCGCNAQQKGCDKQQQACGSHQGKSLRPLFYALDIMKLTDEPEITLALQSYRMNMRSLDRTLKMDAFKEGKFDRELFVSGHAMTQKVAAQAALFEAIYKVLDKDQKVRLHQLMAADLYYNSERKAACCDKKACDGKAGNPDCSKKACDGSGPKRDGSGPNPDCPKK